MLDAAWRTAAAITYEDYVISLGNDGPPETDLVLSAEERQRQQAAIAFIAEQTGISTGFIKGELREAAYAYGQAPDTDDDPDYLGPPDWEDLAARGRELQFFVAVGPQEAALWQRLDNAPWQVQQQFWAGQDPQGNPTIAESTLAAAYQAVADRSGIELVTDAPFDYYGYPILAQDQGMILRDGILRWKGNLVGPAAAPTDAGQQGEGVRATIDNRPASDGTSGRDIGPTSAVRRASAMFFASHGAPATTPRRASSHPGGSGIGPSPHQGSAPRESPRSGRMR